MYVYVRPDSALGSHEMNIDRMIMNQLYPKLLPWAPRTQRPGKVVVVVELWDLGNCTRALSSWQVSFVHPTASWKKPELSSNIHRIIHAIEILYMEQFETSLTLEQRAVPAKPRKCRSQIAKRKMQMVTVMWQHCSSMWFYIMRIMCNVATLGGNIWPQKWCCFPCGLPNPDGPPWIGVSSNWAQGTSEPCPSRCEMHPL